MWSSIRRRRDCLAGMVSILLSPRNTRSRGSRASAPRTAAASRSGITHCRLAPGQVHVRPCTEVPRGVRGSPLTRWAEALMGRDIQAIKFSGEDRGRYRDKLRRSLEVFATMLREHLFEADPAQVGLEIELNLVDERGMPSMSNADVLDAI